MSRRRLRKPLIIVLLLFAAAFAVVYGWRWNIDREGRKKLNAVVAKIDESDPRWRWEDLEADRPGVSNAENSALLVVEFDLKLREKRISYLGRNNGDSIALHEIPPNHLLDDEALHLIENELEERESARPYIRKLRAMPFGRRSLLITPNVMSTTWNFEPEIFRVEHYLLYEFHRAAQRGIADQPYLNVTASLNLGRMSGDEPMVRSQTTRMARARDACTKLERALALDVPSSNLSQIQKEFESESRTDYFRIGIRGHRAFANALGVAVDKGRLDLHSVLCMHNWCGSRASRWSEQLEAWPYTPHLPADLADCLDALSQYVAVANLLDNQQQVAFAAVITPPTDERHKFSTTLLYDLPRFLGNSLATRAALRCVVAGIAIEGYRLLTGDWPVSLEAIPKAILPDVPADPFTAQPLRLAKRADGVTAYSVGLDGMDDGGKIDVRPGLQNVTLDIGFRLYHPDYRRMPALPVRVEPSPKFFHANLGPEPRIVGEEK